MKTGRFLIFSFIVSLVATGCIFQKKDPIQTGVSVVDIKEDGTEKLRIISIGKASTAAIEKNSFAMMRTTACDSSKLMAKGKAQELSLNPRLLDISSAMKSERLLEGGVYCERVYHIDKP